MSEDLVFIANERVWEVRKTNPCVMRRYYYAILGYMVGKSFPIEWIFSVVTIGLSAHSVFGETPVDIPGAFII